METKAFEYFQFIIFNLDIMKKQLLILTFYFVVFVAFAQNQKETVKVKIKTVDLSCTGTVSNTTHGTAALKSSSAETLAASFTSDVTSGQVPLTVQFTDTSTGSPVSWSWDFDNDGNVDSNEQNPVFTYSDVGTYTVKLTVSDGTNTDEVVKSDYITVSCIDVSVSSYVVNFETDENISAWRTVDANSDDNTWGLALDRGVDASQCIAYGFSSDSAANDWAISPCIRLEAGKSYEVKFYYAVESNAYPENLEVRYGTTPDPSMDKPVVDLNSIDNTDFLKSSTVINIYETNSYYFGWHCYSDANMYNLYVDSVSITELESKTVVSTADGGKWWEGSTWVGGEVPKEYDDVVIDGNVSLSIDQKCRSLTVNENDTLTFGPVYDDYTLYVAYDITNNGVVKGVSNGYNITFASGGDVTNNGFWQSVGLLFTGDMDNSLEASAEGMFKYVRIMKQDSVSALIIPASASFYNSFFTNVDDEQFGISNVAYNIELQGDGNAVLDMMKTSSLESVNINGNGNLLKDVYLNRRDNAPYTLLQDIRLAGTTVVNNDSVVFVDNVVVDDTLKTRNSFVTILAAGTFTNEGYIIDDTELCSSGDIINNGLWSAYRVDFIGGDDQYFTNSDSIAVYFQLFAQVDGASSYQWYKDDVLISGATDETYIVDDKKDPYGVYYCKTDMGNSRKITIEAAVTNRITEHQNVTGFRVYPNPAVDNVTVRSEESVMEKIEIYNLAGSLVKSVLTGEMKLKVVKVDDLQPGIYLIKVKTKDGEAVKKLLIM